LDRPRISAIGTADAVTWKLQIARLCGFWMAVGVALAAEEEFGLRVRLYDYAGVSSQTLEKAKSKATAILDAAGVRVEWAECRLRQDDPRKDSSCDLPVRPSDLQIRILDRPMAKRVHATQDCLGYAVVSDGLNSIAAVFFHRAIDLEKGNLITRSAILGAVLAHEIGHLLLSQGGHSETGIMRGSWRDDDLKMIAKGRLCFTDEQSRRIVSNVAGRNASRHASREAISAACSTPGESLSRPTVARGKQSSRARLLGLTPGR
jgi:hypothetical protein